MGQRFMALGLAVAALVLGGCDSDEAAAACEEGMEAGDTIPCMCDDKTGIKTCGDDDKLSECDCTGLLVDGSVPPTGGTGGIVSMTGGTGGSGTGGTGGGGGNDEDAGSDPVDGGPGEPVGPPNDGSELSTCDPTDDTSCGDGLVCYNSGTGPGYCTPACPNMDECDGLGDNVSCSQGACRYTCTGTEDTSCPMFMECMEVVPGTFRCNYPEDVNEPPPPAGDGTIYSVCNADEDCMEDLRCNSYGHCTHDCEEAADCEAASSGDLDPTCSPNTEFMGQPVPGSGCRFTCDPTADNVCPDGLECSQQLGGGRCAAPGGGGGGGLPGGGFPGAGG